MKRAPAYTAILARKIDALIHRLEALDSHTTEIKEKK